MRRVTERDDKGRFAPMKVTFSKSDLKRMYESGLSYGAIRERTGVKSVAYWLKKFGIKPNRNPVRPRLQTSSELAYVLGVMKGDGCTVWNKKWAAYRVELKVRDREFAVAFACALKKINLHPSSWFKKKTKEFIVSACSKVFVKWYKNLGINSIQKIVRNHKVDFLRGFYDSEGGLEVQEKRPNNWGKAIRVRMGNKNREILIMIQRFCKKLGFNSSIRESYDGYFVFSLLGGKEAVKEFLDKIQPSIPRKALRVKMAC